MKKIKILHVVTVLNRGGLETMLMNYYRNINREHFSFDFLVQREQGYYEEEIKKLGGKIYRVPSLSFSVGRLHQYIKALDSFFENHKDYDIVHVHTNSFGYFALKSAYKNNVKVRIIHSHISSLKDQFLKVLVGNFLKRRIPRYANYFFACGNWAGKWLYGNTIDFEIMNNAIDTDNFKFSIEKRKNIRQQLSADSTINIINVGRFNDQKNHLFLIEVFAELLRINKNYRLFLVGEGELEDKIKDKATELDIIGNVEFLGGRNDVNDLLQAMDIFFFPSKFEGLPVALIEAQSSGIQCFISDGIPSESILVKENVDVISLKDSPKSWAKIINSKKDNFIRKDVSGIIAREHFDIKENARLLEKKYTELVERFS